MGEEGEGSFSPGRGSRTPPPTVANITSDVRGKKYKKNSNECHNFFKKIVTLATLNSILEKKLYTIM